MDLPLLANTNDIRLHHFSLNLRCDLVESVFSGYIILFTKPALQCDCKWGSFIDTNNGKSSAVDTDATTIPATVSSKKMRSAELPSITPFKMTLDCCSILVDSAEELLIEDSDCLDSCLKDVRSNWSQLQDICEASASSALHFVTHRWCLQLWKEDCYCPCTFPSVVKISYKTTADGASLKWTVDQDQRPCVFTPAAWINNRSLFPCQEPPVAMTTWQASFQVPKDTVVLMTGDVKETISQEIDGSRVFHYWTAMSLPCSTLALAVGYWCHINLSDVDCFHRPVATSCDHCYHTAPSVEVLPCRLFAPSSLLLEASRELLPWVVKYMKAAHKLLGDHPFPRLDILIVPRCFASLGLASPNLLFLSQSVLTGDGSMAVRVAHEISHAWFGLLIGARDWTEEWISEGFATFMEDVIHCEAMQWTPDEKKDHSQLRALIRHRLLVAEMDNTSEDLQILRLHSNQTDGQVNHVPNGMNPVKCFTQVHYLKGYFLLCHLSALVGANQFMAFLRDFVDTFRGQLVLSKDVLQFFLKSFPSLSSSRGITVEALSAAWLEAQGMPKDLDDFQLDESNKLYAEVCTHLKFWQSFKKKKKRTKLKSLPFITKLTADQTVLLLELLLDESNISAHVLRTLSGCYGHVTTNPDVMHRWCELVVRHKYVKTYSDVHKFIVNHQAMGVYIFGELVHSKCPKQRRLGQACYEEIVNEMDENSRRVVEDMLSAMNR